MKQKIINWIKQEWPKGLGRCVIAFIVWSIFLIIVLLTYKK
jgi:hypothetical protein